MNQETDSATSANVLREARSPTRALDEAMFVPINGSEHWLTIRGADPRNPALLILTGPGGGFSAFSWFFAPWEARFTLVQWDQPGGGKTFERAGTAGGPSSIEQLTSDAVAVVEHVCRRLGKRKIGLLAFSGGTILGLSIAHRRPELVSVYAGSGQIVDWAMQDALGYELLVEQAARAGDEQALAELTAIGPPPYRDTATDAVKSKYAGAPTEAERSALAALPAADLAALQAMPMDVLRARATAAYDALRPEIVAFEARRIGLEFDVPMFFLQGELDVFTVTSEVRRYADAIVAPEKAFVLAKGAGHSAFLMRDEFLRLLERYVRPAAVAAVGPEVG